MTDKLTDKFFQKTVDTAKHQTIEGEEISVMNNATNNLPDHNLPNNSLNNSASNSDNPSKQINLPNIEENSNLPPAGVNLPWKLEEKNISNIDSLPAHPPILPFPVTPFNNELNNNQQASPHQNFRAPNFAKRIGKRRKLDSDQNLTNHTLNHGQERSPKRNKLNKLKLAGTKDLYRQRKFWLGLGTIGLAGGLVYGGYVWYQLEKGLPDVQDIFTFNRAGTLTIQANNQEIIYQSGPVTSEKVKLKDMPPLLPKAFVAIEDRRFYDHTGVDYQGTARAFARNIVERDLVQGGSTITQQLSRVVFLNQERTIWRKVREAMISWKMEKELTKEDILESYLNLVYLGSEAYGVADAAWVYFSKELKDLNLSEIATLAGLAPAPSDYSPLLNPKDAKTRRDIVLRAMQEENIITQAEADQAIAQPLKVNPSPHKSLKVIAPYFASYVKKELPKYVPQDIIDKGGLVVETTLDLKWQKVAKRVVEDAIAIDGSRQGFDQAALVSIDAPTGEVKAMVGGWDYGESEFNRATQAHRQPGSTFKGIVYAAAMAAGFTPHDGYNDVPFVVDGYKPRNYGRKYGGWRSLDEALTKSVNVVAVQLLMDVGFEPVIKLAHNMGIHSTLKDTYSLALGAWEVTLLELTNAYGTFANQGEFVQAHGITKVVNSKGDVVYQAKFTPKRALDKDSAAITTWMLENVVQNGTGSPAALSRHPVAGKTGTSEEARDLWFIGYTPQIVTGVWLGNDNNDPTWGQSTTAAYNWGEFMQEVTKDLPVKEFPKVPDFYNRKPTIKAKPVEPKWVSYGEIGPNGTDPNDKPEGSAWDNSESSDNSSDSSYEN